MNDWEKKVRDFHSKFDADIGDQNLPRFQNTQLRKNLLTEEFNEFTRAVDWGNFDNAVHEAIDILYVTIGALVAWGITDISDYFDEVHAANMRKDGGGKREDKKILKPAGWKPADIGTMIRTQPTRLSKKAAKQNIEEPIRTLELRDDEPDPLIHLDAEKIDEPKSTGGKRGRPSRNN